MIPLHTLEKSIPDLTGMAVLLIAGCAFALSFFNLQAAALQAGISPWLSWLWPVCIDALLIAGSLMILRSSLRNESPWVGWIVLLSFTLVSTIFNVLHSPADVVSQAAHAVPPVALCVSIELLMMCIKSDLKVQPEPPMSTPAPMSTKERILHYFKEQPMSTHTQAAEALGISRSTVSRHAKRRVEPVHRTGA
jgi:predicted XRE-type DNA-binding protein